MRQKVFATVPECGGLVQFGVSEFSCTLKVVLQNITCIMEKHPKEMTCEELYIKLKEDSVNVNVASTVRGETIH